jgi:hypothetical protein
MNRYYQYISPRNSLLYSDLDQVQNHQKSTSQYPKNSGLKELSLFKSTTKDFIYY